ncbi:MAG: ABC transporter permease [Coriobacteriia bacterium]|nr:ABC transporter permease [Coriobacteriia bacterium]
MPVLRDIFRAKGRSVLTIAGVAVGVFLIVLIGAMAENSNRQLESIEDFRAGTVTVAAEGASVNAFSFQTHSWVPRMLPPDALEELRDVPGVREVFPRVALQLDPRAFWLGVPTTIVGGCSSDWLAQQATLAAGRFAAEGERGVAVFGADVATQLDASVGDSVRLRSGDFTVVGILDRASVTMLDQSAFVALDDARTLFVESFDDIYHEQLSGEPVVLSAEVVAADGVDPDELASRIVREVDGVIALGPEKLKRESSGTAATYDSLVMSMGVIALFAGGLSVINTMIISATERTREVGVKRALGASTGRIMRDVLWESAVIGVLGGLLGAATGSLGVWAADAALSASTGMGMFTLTPRLLLFAVAFACAIGVVGGLYPARYAARLDPIDALAHS